MRITLLILLGLLAAGLAVGKAGTALAQVDHYLVESASYDQTAGVAFTVTITARDASDNITAENVTVTLSSNPATVQFDTDSDSEFNDTTAEVINGTAVIQARDNTAHGVTIGVTDGSASGISSTYTISAGPADYIVISPGSTTVTAGSTQTYSAEAFDEFDNSLGDVTSSTDFSISAGAGGTWGGPYDQEYTSEKAGSWTVTGDYGVLSDTATLNVNAASADYILISPNTATITAGETQAYTAEAFDAFDNSLGDVTSSTTFTIVEAGHGGSWTGNTYTSANTGTWTVRGTYNITLTDDASLTVNAGSADHIVISPSTATITAGSTRSYTAEAFDEFDNSLGDVTSSTTFTIVEAGHGGSWTGSTYTSANTGTWTVRGTYNTTLTDDASLTVNAGSADHIVISPSTATITAGSTRSYIAEAFDEFDNSLGSVTGSTDFSITSGAGGSWALSVYTSATAGSWTVTGEYNGLTDTAALTVNPAAAASIAMTPAGGSTTAGIAFSVTVTARDAYGNLATGYTGIIHFTSTDTAATLPGNYTFSSGSHTFTNGVTLFTSGSRTITVTDTGNGSLTDTETWSVSPTAAVSIAFSPAGGSAVAGISFPITVTAHDAYGNVAAGYTGTVHFSSTDGAATLPADYVFVSGDSGAHTFSVTLLTAGDYSVTVTDTGNGSLTDTGTWSVNPSDSIHHIVITPDTATITAGGAQAYAAQAYDEFGNPIGDVTSQTTFEVDDAAAGSWDDVVYTSEKAGTWTVTGTYATLTDTATLYVNASSAHHVVISPGSETITAGAAQAYTAEAFDQWDNSLGLVTDNTSFSIQSGAGGSWAANVYTSRTAGTWTVTGAWDTPSGTAILVVNAGAIHHYGVSSSSYSQQASVAFTVTVTAYDAFDNVVNDSSTLVTMSSDSPNVSFDANGDGVFDDSARTLADGRFTIAAKCSAATSSLVITATSDGVSGTSPAYTVTADPALVPPVAEDDSYDVPQDTILMSAAPGVLGNDAGAEGSALTAVLVTSVSHGTLRLKTDGSFTYTPDSGFAGADSFTYRAAGELAESDIATVTINVTGLEAAGGVPFWVWVIPCLALVLLGTAGVIYWRIRGKRATASAIATAFGAVSKETGETSPPPTPAATPEAKVQTDLQEGPVQTVNETAQLDSVATLKARMARLSQQKGNTGDKGSG